MEAPLALYRRYRPEKFSEVIGQDHVTVPLRNALSNNRVNHAYLFSGPRGCGKTTSARILARAINCEKGPIAEPCGECQSCRDLARGGPGSIDVLEIDAASHGGVDDARDLREKAFFSPVQSRYKIYIIDEAHMVTTQGFNALLKLVEEPPPHLKFIFATTEPDKVIGTIRSRTHHYPFRLVPPKQLADYMATLCEAEGVTIEPAALPLVVRAGAGSVRDSLSVLDQLIGGADADGVTYQLAVALLGFTPDSLLDACVDGFAAHDSRAVFETVEKVIETGQDPKRFAEDLLRRLRDLVILSAVPNAVASGLIEAAEDQGERLQTQAAGIGAAELTRAADIVAAGLLEMRGATAPRLQLELICAKVLLPGADDSTNGIQARLDRMERRLTIGVPTAEAPTAPPRTPPAPAAAGPTQATAPAARASQAAAPAEPPSAGAPSQGAASLDRSGGWPQESAPPSSGSMGLADVRRLWPQILEAVKTKRRFAWIMLSQNAQVIAIDEQTITLGLVNAGARESFARSGSDEILRQAMIDTIGLTRKVEALVDPSTDPGAAAAAQPSAQVPSAPPQANPAAWDQSAPPSAPPVAQPPVQPSAGPGAAGTASGPQLSAGPQGVAPPSAQLSATAQSTALAEAPATTQVAASSSGSAPTQVSMPVQVSASTGQPNGAVDRSGPAGTDSQAAGNPGASAPDSEPVADERREQAASKRRAAEAAVAAERAKRAALTPVTEAPLTPEEEAEAIGEDDVILEEDSRSHTDLLRETLGAQIITEEPN